MLHGTHYMRLRRYVFHVRAADSAGHVGTAASYGWAFASVLPVLVLEALPVWTTDAVKEAVAEAA